MLTYRAAPPAPGGDDVVGTPDTGVNSEQSWPSYVAVAFGAVLALGSGITLLRRRRA